MVPGDTGKSKSVERRERAGCSTMPFAQNKCYHSSKSVGALGLRMTLRVPVERIPSSVQNIDSFGKVRRDSTKREGNTVELGEMHQRKRRVQSQRRHQTTLSLISSPPTMLTNLVPNMPHSSPQQKSTTQKKRSTADKPEDIASSNGTSQRTSLRDQGSTPGKVRRTGSKQQAQEVLWKDGGQCCLPD